MVSVSWQWDGWWELLLLFLVGEEGGTKGREKAEPMAMAQPGLIPFLQTSQPFFPPQAYMAYVQEDLEVDPGLTCR